MNRKIQIGVGLLVLSYGQLLVPKNWSVMHHFAAGFILTPCVALFALGVIVLSEGIVERFKGVSLLSLARGDSGKLIRFLFVAGTVGLLAEIFAQWLGKLWYYAYYPTWFYWPALIPSFIFYWVMIIESYMATKAILDHVIKRGGEQKEGPLAYHQIEHTLYTALGTVGFGLLLFGLVELFFNYQAKGGYVFDTLRPVVYAPPVRYVVSCFAGVWFIGEAVLYTRGLPSLIRSLLHGYIVPAVSILSTSVIVSLIWESQNAHVGYWIYTNWPGLDKTVFGVQLSVLSGWPMNYVVYLVAAAAIMASWAPVFWSRPEEPKKRKAIAHEV
ncbi:MAG TPA: hypothetical protein VLH38_05780 [Patescibacteria group bacterium]|nr:hypothetical protein [Patescibacteria group bacterium]